ncbi:hypothetical protein Hanom_Chr08g00716471 [Helianthus anomalus]
MPENANRSTWAMYPRFIQMLINKKHPKLPYDGDLYTFQLPTSRQITEIKINEWLMLHDWVYKAERLPLVKASFKKYRDGIKAKNQRFV